MGLLNRLFGSSESVAKEIDIDDKKIGILLIYDKAIRIFTSHSWREV